MIRSMYSGVTGMKNHQIRMDTLSNNIANVNTTGYKSARTNFQDALYQTIRSGGGATKEAGDTVRGSINPSQIGLGMQVGSISVNFTQGPMLYTGRTLDLGIDGEGFFKVTTGTGDNLNEFYTRDGVFYVDTEGYLVTGDGFKVQGPPDSNGKTEDIRIVLKDDNTKTAAISEISIDANGKIIAKSTKGEDMIGTADIALFGFVNKEGLKRAGKNLYIEQTEISGQAELVDKKAGSTINSGYLEGANVELTEEFTNMITTQRGYQANARVITTSDHMLEELINLKR